MDYNQVESSITNKTKAILAVNIFGNAVDIKKIKKIIKKRKIYIVEDCAESVGTTYENMMTGSYSDVSIFSFYTNKLITSGEGGAVCTSNLNIYKRVEKYKNLFFGSSERFAHKDIGYNYRFTNLQAAIAYSSFKQIKINIKKIQYNAELYKKYLSCNSNIIFQETNKLTKKIWWMYPIVFKNLKNEIEPFRKYLFKNSIDSRNLFKPLDTMPFLKNISFKSVGNKNSKYLYNNGLYLPSGLDLTESKIKYICSIVNKYK